jgi:hypothetical protein
MLRMHGHIFAGDGAACACCSLTDKRAMSDPTGTLRLRSRLKGTLRLRWQKLRILAKQIIIDHDLLQLNAAGLMPVKQPAVNNGGTKIQAFQRWFDNGLNTIVLGGDGSVMRPMLNQAYMMGVSFAAGQLGRRVMSGDAQHKMDLIFQLAVTELQGVIEAVSQQAAREVAAGLVLNQSAKQIVAAVQAIIDNVGIVRTAALVDVIVISEFNQAALDSYEAAKVKQVGIIAEAKAKAKVGDAFGSRISRKVAPSTRTIQRIKKQERQVEALGNVNVLTAGDDDVCPICEDIADNGPYTINEARSLIPAHPHCRCTFTPVGDGILDGVAA